MKKLNILLLFTISIFLFGQKYNYPRVVVRPNKSAAIKSVEVLDQMIKINIEYIGSSRKVPVDYINISPDTKLFFSNETNSKLLKAEGIEIAPNQTKFTKNLLMEFSLYFEKPDVLDINNFSVVEDQNNPYGFNFFFINTLKDNKNYSNYDSPKNDYFLSDLPDLLQVIFYHDYFIETNHDSRELFDYITEKLSDKTDKIQILEINTEEMLSKQGNNKLFVYTVTPENYNPKTLSFYYDITKNGNRIDQISLYYIREDDARNFFNSISDWYGATMNKQRNKSFFHDQFKKNMYDVYFSIDKMYNTFYEVKICTYTKEETDNMIEEIKKTRK